MHQSRTSVSAHGHQVVPTCTLQLSALKTRCRYIDAAAMYGNETAVGKGIRDSGIPREEIFVTTKLWNTQQRDPASALNESLERLGLDYVDLFLIHWPVPLKPVGGSKNILKYPTQELHHRLTLKIGVLSRPRNQCNLYQKLVRPEPLVSPTFLLRTSRICRTLV